MSIPSDLVAQLRAQVLLLEDDLRARVAALPTVDAAWRAEYAAAREVERTAASWQEWADERVTLAATSWVLTSVFIRFCEDNGLVAPVWIAGPRVAEALAGQQEFLRESARSNPDVTDREWLLEAVTYLRSLPATAGLVDGSSPMWLVSPSGDAVTRLLAFWREHDGDGLPLRSLAVQGLDTRFLGDVYQDVSEDARSRYALLQTPVFVEEFILDRTLEPALAERPLEGFRLIDPTCGSGHFLLGAFARLLDRWHRHAPGLDERERVQRALDAVHGVDLNPYAVAVARFRLTVAALVASGMSRLEDAPAFRYHLAVGDSLLHGLDEQELPFGAEFSADRMAAAFTYATENLEALRTILANRSYDVVVGNPPYITVKDKALNARYRGIYQSCHRKYALTVPFMERFFALATTGDRPGWVGQITSNSFMKREFGSKLIESFLPSKDLRLVVDTSGAYIPGHGTPTVIIVGRNTRPATSTVRAVLGVRGEPGQPADPAHGIVWSSIVAHVDDPGWNDEFITVADLDRDRLATHPWSLSGGGAVELLAATNASGANHVGELAFRIGFFGIIGADDAMTVPWSLVHRRGLELSATAQLVVGEELRDYRAADGNHAWFPYSPDHQLQEITRTPVWACQLWPMRTELGNRPTFTKGTYFTDGRPWYEWHQLPEDRGAHEYSIAFAFVATHNHFVLDRGGKVFKQSAPVIKLPSDASEDAHLELLGVLNSSTACFWLKQNSHNKGEGGGARVEAGYAAKGAEAWRDTYEFTGTTLQDFPLPAVLPLERGRLLDSLAQRLSSLLPHAIVADGVPTRAGLDAARAEAERVRARMVAVQEELDWQVYGLYGLIEEDLTYPGDGLPELALGERAFEIVLARRVADASEQTAWFERHRSTPITQVPEHWPAAYRALVERRIELASSHPFLRLLERPEHKRRWAHDPWEKLEEAALRGWLLDRLEGRGFWFDQQGRPAPRSITGLADLAARDPDLVAVLALWEGRPDVPVAHSLTRLLSGEGVPYLAALRLKESGLRKRAAWEETWALQRREDAGTYNPAPRERGGDGPIPVPPKYTSADFLRSEFWSQRGKLDVPKERFITYPGAQREGDDSLVLGWAGWDHAQQALALAMLIHTGRQHGWADERLVPLVAGLAEVMPWVAQWHADPDPAYGGESPASYLTQVLEQHLGQLGMTRAEVAAWRPTPARRGRKARS